MKCILAALIVLCPTAALASPAMLAPSAQIPQPAVVRIVAVERDGASMGSGALVAVDGQYGLVITNWHVVRDAAGPITVVFPDGTHFGAIVLKTDRDWDLAALAIRKPKAQPLPMATEPPRPGEPLSIAGYGPDGVYRAVGGRCTEYLSPRENLPAELVEVDVQARKGDSGGPICNSRGEIAGILFGAGGNFFTGGYTMGSYCGRVRQFLAASYVVFQRMPGREPTGHPRSGSASKEQGAASTLAVGEQQTTPHTNALPQVEGSRVAQVPTVQFEAASGGQSSKQLASSLRPPSWQPQAEEIAGSRPRSTSRTEPLQSNPIAQVSPVAENTPSEPPSHTEQIKTVLAVIGVIAMLFHGLRLIGAAAG